MVTQKYSFPMDKKKFVYFSKYLELGDGGMHLGLVAIVTNEVFCHAVYTKIDVDGRDEGPRVYNNKCGENS